MKKNNLPSFLPSTISTPSKKDVSFMFKTVGYNNDSLSPVGKGYIVVENASFLTKNQVEICKKIITRDLKRTDSSYSTMVQYNILKTQKASGSRMGKGKGKVVDRVAFIKKNETLFEFTNIHFSVLQKLIFKIKYKIPVSISLKHNI
jgi:ribosomal protein L16/L10AE